MDRQLIIPTTNAQKRNMVMNKHTFTFLTHPRYFGGCWASGVESKATASSGLESRALEIQLTSYIRMRIRTNETYFDRRDINDTRNELSILKSSATNTRAIES